MKFRKKPVVIEAIRFDGTENGLVQILRLSSSKHIDCDHGGKTIFIHTLEGKMEASLGDWIIKGVKGEIYPCKPDIFEATYELFEEDKSHAQDT